MQLSTSTSSNPSAAKKITLAQIKDVLAAIQSHAPKFAPLRVWEAYARLDALAENARPLTGLDETLTPFDATVRRNCRDWILRKNAGEPFNESKPLGCN